MLPITNFRFMVHPPHPLRGAEDYIPQLASASRKGVGSDEDHVQFVVDAFNTAMEAVRRKSESAPFREERRGEVFIESELNHHRVIDNITFGIAHGVVFYRSRDCSSSRRTPMIRLKVCSALTVVSCCSTEIFWIRTHH
jgi:hypothetical protein